MEMKDIINDLLNGVLFHSRFKTAFLTICVSATIDTEEDLENTFDVWGIDPLWHETDENGKDRVVDWVSLRFDG